MNITKFDIENWNCSILMSYEKEEQSLVSAKHKRVNFKYYTKKNTLEFRSNKNNSQEKLITRKDQTK